MTNRELKENREKFEEIAKRYTDNSELFILNETLRVFCEAESDAVKLEALKVLAAQR